MATGRPNVEKKALALLEATNNLFVSGTILVSGNIRFSDGTELSSAVGAGGDHGALAGLADDDHPQYLHIDGRRGVLGDLGVSGSLFLGAGGAGVLYASASCLVLSCSLDSTVITSGNHIMDENLLIKGLTHNPQGHLIFSSSVGSVVAISGSTKLGQVTQANLPAGSDTLSGSLLWVSDLKCAAIYGPEGWTRILTGTL